LFWDFELTKEEEEKIIKKAAEIIHRYGMEVAAILMLESVKPLLYIGGQLGRFFAGPFLPLISNELGRKGETILRVFEKKENVEKLIKLLEEMAKEKREERSEEKRGLRRFLPF